MLRTNAPAITPNLRVGEVVASHPETIPVFQRHGLPCSACYMSRFENVGEGARVHRLDLGALLTDLNAALAGR